MIKLDFWNKKRKKEAVEVVPWGGHVSHDRFPDTTRSSVFAAGEDDWDLTQSSPVFSTRPEYRADGSRSRSYEEFLRARNQPRPLGSYGGAGRRFYDDEDDASAGLSLRRGMQILGAVALTAVLYFTFHSDGAMSQRVQAFVKQSMTQDSNVTALSSWWQDNFSSKLALPVSSTVSGTKDMTFVMPVKGTVKTQYDGNTQQGITFSAAPGAEVKASSTGTVEKVEDDGKGDITVTVSHGTRGKTIYRHLATVTCKATDWVDSTQAIGTLAKKGDSADLFFAYQKDGSYIDPMSVLDLTAGR